jgi:hypothetical protein
MVTGIAHDNCRKIIAGDFYLVWRAWEPEKTHTVYSRSKF